jgi:hypothetical protein
MQKITMESSIRLIKISEKGKAASGGSTEERWDAGGKSEGDFSDTSLRVLR